MDKLTIQQAQELKNKLIKDIGNLLFDFTVETNLNVTSISIISIEHSCMTPPTINVEINVLL